MMAPRHLLHRCIPLQNRDPEFTPAPGTCGQTAEKISQFRWPERLENSDMT